MALVAEAALLKSFGSESVASEDEEAKDPALREGPGRTPEHLHPEP